MFAKDILRDKGFDVTTITPDARVADVARLFLDNRIGFALVMGPDDHEIVGTVSERDIIHGLALGEGAVAMEPVGRLMTTNVVTCKTDTSVNDMMEMMTEKRTRHVLVMDGPDLKGVVSIGDLIKTQITEFQHEAQAMRDYVVGNGYH